MTDPALFAPDYREQPYWWEAAPRPNLDPVDPPATAEIVIIGSGITGLNAAIPLARAGRHVVVLDAEDAGTGASSRNAGFVGRTLKHDFGTLLRKHGRERARAIYGEMQAAFDAVTQVTTEEAIDCHLQHCGRLILAAAPRQLRGVIAELECRREHLGGPFEVLSRADLEREIATDAFVGGALIPDLGSIHPGLYHAGLLRRAQEAGVQLCAHTQATAIAPRNGAGPIAVQTSRGPVIARDVIIATNGYTGPGAPAWLRRGTIPFDAYMIATETLAPDTIGALLPGNRTFIDANHNIAYIRRAPDGTRLLFGAQTGAPTRSLRARAASLHRAACRILPGLAGIRIAYAWTGRCAGTFDLYPHIGHRDGIHFAGGYCFAGIPMGTYFGRKLAARVLGDAKAGATLFDQPLPTLPLYDRQSWFVPAAMRIYDLMDAWSRRPGLRPAA